MTLQFLAHSHIALTSLEAVDGADVVQTTAGYKATRWSIGTRHHPAGPQRDSMDLHIRKGRESVREMEADNSKSSVIGRG